MILNFNKASIKGYGFAKMSQGDINQSEIGLVYILIEKGTTFQLKSIPLIEVKPVALQMQKQHKNDDKHGYKTRDYQTIFSGVR